MEEQQDIQFGSYPVPQHQEDKNQLIKAQFDISTLLTQIKYFLLGYDIDDNGKLICITDAQLCNERGARALLFELENKLATPVVLGQLTDEEAKKRALIFELDLLEELGSNYIDWEVNGMGAITTVQNALGDIVFSNFTRSIKGRTHQGLISMAQIQETQQIIQRDQTQPEKKPNVIRRMFGG